MTTTVRDLKNRLIRQGGSWSVDPRLNDEEPLPKLPRGGQEEEDIPTDDRIAPLGREVDVKALIATTPPSNPWLLLWWVEEGLLERSAAEGIVPTTGEKQFGAS